MILNYHHRMADTHNMPEWVSLILFLFSWQDCSSLFCQQTSDPSGQCCLPAVAALAPQDGQAGREDHQEDHHDGQEDEGARHQGDLLQVVALQCSGYGR